MYGYVAKKRYSMFRSEVFRLGIDPFQPAVLRHRSVASTMYVSYCTVHNYMVASSLNITIYVYVCICMYIPVHWTSAYRAYSLVNLLAHVLEAPLSSPYLSFTWSDRPASK